MSQIILNTRDHQSYWRTEGGQDYSATLTDEVLEIFRSHVTNRTTFRMTCGGLKYSALVSMIDVSPCAHVKGNNEVRIELQCYNR